MTATAHRANSGAVALPHAIRLIEIAANDFKVCAAFVGASDFE